MNEYPIGVVASTQERGKMWLKNHPLDNTVLITTANHSRGRRLSAVVLTELVSQDVLDALWPALIGGQS